MDKKYGNSPNLSPKAMEKPLESPLYLKIKDKSCHLTIMVRIIKPLPSTLFQVTPGNV